MYQTGGIKETPAQYNARVMAQYYNRTQEHSDSTAAYNKAVIIDDLYNEGQDIKNKATQTLFNRFPQEQENEEAVNRSVREADDLRAQETEIYNKDTEEKLINPDLIQDRNGYFRDEYGRYHQETEETKRLLREKWKQQREKEEEYLKNRQKYVSEAKTNRKTFVEGLTKGGEIVKEGKALEDELQEGEIYPTSKRKLVKTGDADYSYTNTAKDVKPGPPPREPAMKMKPLSTQTLPTNTGTPEPLTGATMDYIYSGDKKYIIDVHTGEKHKIPRENKPGTWFSRGWNKAFPERDRRPGKRRVLNLVTGKTNRVQKHGGTRKHQTGGVKKLKKRRARTY